MTNNIDTEKFTEAIEGSSEIELDMNELIQNARINEDGSIESHNEVMWVLLSPDYEVVDMAGGVSPEMSKNVMEEIEECID